ncbi:MAG: DUF1667 domain-containing protein [Oscillospiraceae bacterium]|nr:DUF1667 domain-containing protein [Oscillospiraceae bacterium]
MLFSDDEYFTTYVKVKCGNQNVVPIRSTKPIDKKLWIECSKALRGLNVGTPVKIGDIVCENLLNLRVNMIAVKEIYSVK